MRDIAAVIMAFFDAVQVNGLKWIKRCVDHPQLTNLIQLLMCKPVPDLQRQEIEAGYNLFLLVALVRAHIEATLSCGAHPWRQPLLYHTKFFEVQQ